MSTEAGASVAHRLIARDEAIRGAGKSPPWDSVRRIIEYTAQQGLLTDAAVARWLRTVAASADLWISHRLLQIVCSLLEASAVEEAHALYRCVIGLDDASRWEALASALARRSMLVEAGIEPVLGRPGLLTGAPKTWGRTACELLGRVVLQHERDEWPSHLAFLAAVAKHLDEPFEPDQPFELSYDDNPALWYFGPNGSDAPRKRVARMVEQALREAARHPEAEAFRQLGGFLLCERFAIGVGLQLAVLLDSLRETSTRFDWHAPEAIRLLTLEAVQEHATLHNLRGLLRLELPKPLDAATATALTDVIRRSALPEQNKLQELADVAEWGVLHDEERAHLAEEAARGALFPPSDPRNVLVIRRGRATVGPATRLDDTEAEGPVSREGAPPPSPMIAGRPWPYPEDAEAIRVLEGIYHGQVPETLGAAAERLGNRLSALQTVLGRREADDERWVGEILGWCHTVVTEVRGDELRRQGRDLEEGTLSAAEWERVLTTRAPWWSGRAEASLRCLGGPVPGYHAERRPGGLSWGSSDSVMQSLSYLDEILAVDGGEPFAPLRRQLESIVDAAWPGWPAFTRATALSVLRPWYWWNLERLRGRLSDLAAQETDPLVANYAVERILNIGGPDMAANLERILARAETIADLRQTIDRLGRELGYAFLQHRGGGHRGQEVEGLAALCSRVQASPPTDPATRADLIKGMLWGAGNCLQQAVDRSEAHATVWASLVLWASSAWPYLAESSPDDDSFPVLALMLGLEQQWPPGLRRRLFDELEETLLGIILKGTLADFCWLHHMLSEFLRGGRPGSPGSSGAPIAAGELSDALLLSLCRASATRVVTWRATGKTTHDLGWVSALSGQETADLIRAVLAAGADRDHLRRELPPVIDQLAEAGCSGTATELRLYLRRR